MVHKVEKMKDILTFAIEREVEAYELYIYMAAHMANPEMRIVCEDLAKKELEHKAKLEQEFIKIGETVTDLNVSDYVTAADNPMDMDCEDLLVFAIKKENQSIKLYNDLAKIVEDNDSRQVLLFLVNEEIDHKQCFETEYQSLQTQPPPPDRLPSAR